MTPTCYHGARLGDGGYRVIAHDKQTGGRYDLPHVKRHSLGLSWGYEGSGPADLARSLLIDALGPAAACPLCDGTVYVVWCGDLGDAAADPVPYDPERHRDADPELIANCYCDDGYRALPYQAIQARARRPVGRSLDDHPRRGAALASPVLRRETPSWLLEAIGVRTVELPELPS